MIIVKNTWFPFGRYKAINIFGILFTKAELSEIDINHEKIHNAQMKEMLYVFFYLWYAIEYIIIWVLRNNLSQNKKYHEISFEEEAYKYQSNLAYLRQRKHYEWFKYIGMHSNE